MLPRSWLVRKEPAEIPGRVEFKGIISIEDRSGFRADLAVHLGYCESFLSKQVSESIIGKRQVARARCWPAVKGQNRLGFHNA